MIDFLLLTLLFNLLLMAFCLSLNNNKFSFNNSNINFIESRFFNKKQLRKIKQRKIINFIKQRKKQMLLDEFKLIDLNKKTIENKLNDKAMSNTKLNEQQKSYCVFKKRQCGYWKIYICQQDWEKALKIIDKIFSSAVKIAKLSKIVAVDLIALFMMQNQLIKVTITTIVVIILKLIEEGFTMICSIIENNKFATQVIVKFWMLIPFWISFR